MIRSMGLLSKRIGKRKQMETDSFEGEKLHSIHMFREAEDLKI